MNFASVLEYEDGKIMGTAETSVLGNAVLPWFSQQRAICNTLSGSIVCEKAKILTGNIDGLSEFKASNGLNLKI